MRACRAENTGDGDPRSQSLWRAQLGVGVPDIFPASLWPQGLALGGPSGEDTSLHQSQALSWN